MAENPLLPHRKLKELHALMLRCRELERTTARHTSKPAAGREAVLAATSMHLQPGDVLFPEANDLVAAQLAPATKAKHLPAPVPPSKTFPRLALAAAAARGLQAANTEGLALAYAQAGVSEIGWAEALEYAWRNQLPFVLACVDSSVTRKGAKALTWANVSRLAKRLELPVLPVDGGDAVAVYRVMQEASLHARIGGGPAVIWAVLSNAPGVTMSASQQPLGRLKSYLNVRGIKV